MRGFMRGEFVDLYSDQCSIQESSLAEVDAIWLGVHKTDKGDESTRMHLNREMVAALLPLLKRFVKTGQLKERDA